jgi:hypothetical protein
MPSIISIVTKSIFPPFKIIIYDAVVRVLSFENLLISPARGRRKIIKSIEKALPRLIRATFIPYLSITKPTQGPKTANPRRKKKLTL